MVLCPYWAKIRRWISTVSLLLSKETAQHHDVLRWRNLAKGGPCFRPGCCHSTEGSALYCTWLNSSTGIVNSAQCANSSLSRLPHNLKIAFNFDSPSYDTELEVNKNVEIKRLKCKCYLRITDSNTKLDTDGISIKISSSTLTIACPKLLN